MKYWIYGIATQDGKLVLSLALSTDHNNDGEGWPTWQGAKDYINRTDPVGLEVIGFDKRLDPPYLLKVQQEATIANALGVLS